MKFSIFCVTISACMVLGTEAMAVTPQSQSTLSRRQLNGCMSKQMAASRTISYNEASRVCKDQIKAQSDALSGADTLSSNNEAKPANAR